MTNVEKIAIAITKGATNIMIHKIPTTHLWLVCEKILINQWKMTICDPFGTGYRLLGENITDDNHVNLIESLIKIKAPRQQEAYLLK